MGIERAVFGIENYDLKVGVLYPFQISVEIFNNIIFGLNLLTFYEVEFL